MFTAKRHNPLHLLMLLSLAVGLLAGGLTRAQDNAADLEELVGPVALYPDDLLGIVLPASSYPLQVVQAARFLEDRKSNPDLKPDEEWDDAVVALLNYPEIVAQMSDDLDWTWALGEAFINEQTATMDAIQRFRERARLAGNLKSDDHQVVHEVEGAIEIEPADPEVIYVPYYEPARVVVRHYRPVYSYYPRAYPVYYYPYRYGYTFADDVFWGVSTYFAFNWISHSLHARHYSHYSHPYRGYTYRRPLYTRHHLRSHRASGRFAHNDVWRPSRRHGARPRHGVNTRRHSDFARGDRRVNNRVNRNGARGFQQPRINRRGDRRANNRIDRNGKRAFVQPRVNRNGDRRTNNRTNRNRNHAAQQPRVNRGGAQNANRNGSRSSFAPRNSTPRRATNPNRATNRNGIRAQNRGQNQRLAPNNGRQQRAAPRQQRRNSDAGVRVAQNRSGAAARRNSMANTNRSAASRQQRAAPRQAAPRRAAPRRVAPQRAAPPARSNAKRAARSQPRRQSQRAATGGGSRRSSGGKSKFAGRSGSNRR